MKEVKSIFASKTMWLNAIVATLTIVALFNPDFLSAFGVEGASQVKVLKVAGAITAALNMILRMLNGAPVALNPSKANDATK